MKLIQLEILNLASLDRQGGEVINFEKGALGDSTIFSIVGPTGSGKSTILDAICLALYGRAPRYPKKKNDKKQNIEIYGTPDANEKNRLAPTDCRNILTRGKKEGYSKLTFQANDGSVYRAEWHIRFLTKNYEQPKTFLYKLSRLVDGTQKEEIAEWDSLPIIIGLDYEQFLRTVLIAQGSFANFLNAKENERYELLEKLIGCEEMYTRIANEIKTQKDAAIKAFNIVNASVDAVKQNLLPNEERQRLEEEIDLLEKKLKEIEATKKNLETQLQWYAEDKEMALAIEKHQELLKQASKRYEEILPDILQLNLHDAISPAVEILRDVKELEAAIVETQKNIAANEKKSKEHEELIRAENDRFNLLKGVAQKAQQDIEETAPHIQKARELRTKIDAATDKCKEKQDAKATAEKEKNTAGKAVNDNKSDIVRTQNLVNEAKEEHQALLTEIDNKKEELKKSAEEAEQTLGAELLKVEGMNAEELQAKKTQADSDWQNINQALEVVGLLALATEEQNQKKACKNELEERNVYLKNELAKLNIDSLKKELETLRKSYTLMISEQWNLHRASLEEGKPCPLCGATNHPYIVRETDFEEATSELYDMLKTKESSLKKQEEDKMKWTGEMSKNEGEISGLTQRLHQLKADIESYEKKWQSLIEWNPQLKKDQEKLKAALQSYNEKREEAGRQLSFFNKVQIEIGRLRKKKEEADKKQAKYVEEAADLKNKALEKVNSALTKLENAKTLSPTLIQQHEEKLKTLDEATKAWQQADDDLKKLQSAYKEELGDEEPDAVEQRLKSKKDAADADVSKKSEEISKINASLGEIKGALQAQTKQLDNEKLRLTTKKTELTEWIVQYNAKEGKIQDVSQNDVEKMLLSQCDWAAIREEIRLRKEEVVSNEALLKNSQQAYAKHHESKPEKERETLLAELQELQETSPTNELVEAKARMQNHYEAISRLGDKVGELNRVTKIKDDWTSITDAIGGDGKTLRKIAQCYTLSFLIEHANAEIRKFNSRYELVQVKNSLGIRVIDHDRADDVRDTTSLSGGETFIVSLGLALGLSSLSSRNISFENLFIDEGFGTLDPDMLATVIDSLAMLQSSQGKKVGVISHTNTMSERITTQIRIVKNGNSGSSHIEIYP